MKLRSSYYYHTKNIMGTSSPLYLRKVLFYSLFCPIDAEIRFFASLSRTWIFSISWVSRNLWYFSYSVSAFCWAVSWDIWPEFSRICISFISRMVQSFLIQSRIYITLLLIACVSAKARNCSTKRLSFLSSSSLR